MVRELYYVPEIAGVRLSKPSETVLAPEEGFVAVYEAQLKNGLRFPILGLLGEVIRHYGVSIAQVYLIGICRLIAFEMACKQARVKSSLMLFRQFYQIKGMGGMFYFSTRPKGKDFLGASANLVGGWRRRHVTIRAANFLVRLRWRRLRGGDRRPTFGFSVQEVRRLEDVDPIDLSEVTSAMLEEVGLWKRVEVGMMRGEGSASWEAGEGSNLLILLKWEL